MADEIRATLLLSFTKAPATALAVGESDKSFTVSGSKYMHGVQAIATDATALDVGPITVPGWYYIKNIDPTNYVELLTAAAGAVFGKLKPGEFTIGRFGVAAPALKAHTGACNIEYAVIDD